MGNKRMHIHNQGHHFAPTGHWLFEQPLFMRGTVLPTHHILPLHTGDQACLKVHQKPVDYVAVLSRKAFSQCAGPVSPSWKWTFFWYLFSSSTVLWLFCLMRHEIRLQEVWPLTHKMRDSFQVSFLHHSVLQIWLLTFPSYNFLHTKERSSIRFIESVGGGLHFCMNYLKSILQCGWCFVLEEFIGALA